MWLRLGRKKQEREIEQTARSAIRVVSGSLGKSHARTLPESRRGNNEAVHLSVLLRGFEQ
jgi:hypothetical protein